MSDRERRHHDSPIQRAMARELNDHQLDTLRQLEHFGWELKFVRHPLFQPCVPVVFDGDRKKFAVLEADGSLNENPAIKIRC